MLAMEHTAKFRPSFEGCYNYNKLKSEGLVDEEILDDEIKKSNVDPKGEFDKQSSNQINNFNIRPTDTGNNEINEFNKRRNEIILQKK